MYAVQTGITFFGYLNFWLPTTWGYLHCGMFDPFPLISLLCPSDTIEPRNYVDMSEVATPKGAAVEGISAMPLACEPLAGKCLRVLQKKGTETGESRVANLISVFSVRVQDDVASLGGIGTRRSSTGERNYHRRESSQGGALDETTRQGDAETSRSPTKREEKAPLLLRDPQSSPSKDNPLKASVEGGTEASMTSEPAAHTSPIGKRKSSRLENNPFIQNDQKKLGEFGSPIKGGGLRRSQKNTNAVAHTEVTGVAQEHPPEVSKDNATSTGQQQCSEPQQNNVVPSQFKLVSQSPDFLRRNKLSASPDSPRKVPMTPPKVKGDVWSISLIPQQSAASSETGQGNHLVGSAEVQVKPPPPTSPSPQDDQEGHVYDDVVVAASAVVRQVEGSNGLGVIPVGMLPIASSELVREDSLGEMCLLVQFHDSTVPPGMVGGVPQPTGFRVEPAAEGTTATDMTVSLQSNEQEDINEVGGGGGGGGGGEEAWMSVCLAFALWLVRCTGCIQVHHHCKERGGGKRVGMEMQGAGSCLQLWLSTFCTAALQKCLYWCS